jgi:PEGA domain
VSRLGVLLVVAGLALPARAEPPKPPKPAEEPAGYALFRLDPLGIEPQIVEQLERILRVELERVIGSPLPSRDKVEKVAAANPKLAACTANPECLVPLAKALSSSKIIAGNVGGLGDSYVVNLKLVDKDGRELRRVSATLHGSPEELIDEIRVATYRLVAPEKLVGSVAVLSDLPGATVSVDGNAVGKTPLPGPLAGLAVGVHHLSVTREGFSSVDEDVPVRFEKTSQLVVHQKAVSEAAKRAERRARGETPVYAKWWFWTAMAVSAVATGVGIGFAIQKQQVQTCAMGKCQ